jgi:quinolinate synthase
MPIVEEILKLKRDKIALILAHYYTDSSIREVADYVGDSYLMSKTAADSPCSLIICCGVSFMGESVKLLCPDKTVLMPDITSDCPMAHMVKKESINKARQDYPDLAVVCYINSTAEIKSWSDVCVTSANAVKIVSKLPNKNILFIPDKNLGAYVAEQIPDKNFIPSSGFCPVHESMSQNAEKLIAAHPAAKVLVHPECNKRLRDKADYIGSTSGIIDFASKSEASEFIIATETGIKYELKKNNPEKTFYFIENAICRDMKKITLQKIYDILLTGNNEVFIDKELQASAAKTLDRMLLLA